MKRMFKTWVLWLLVLAMPIQSLAAVLQVSCGPAHHPLAQVSAHAHASSGHQMHQAHQVDSLHDLQVMQVMHDMRDMHHAHDDGIEHGAVPAAFQDADPAAATAASSSAPSQCSACAVCQLCAALLLPGGDSPPAHASPGFASAWSDVSFTGHVPDRLKRPPRLFLA